MRHSAAPADTGHGRKLYVLRSNDAETYLKHLHGDPLAVEANAAVEGPVSIPVGLTLVKQAFAPEPYDGEPPPEVTVYGSRDGLVDGYYQNNASTLPRGEADARLRALGYIGEDDAGSDG